MRKRLIVMLAGALALCLVLVGCGTKAADASAFIGTWELYETESNGELTTHEDLQQTKDIMGLSVYLDLNEDGTMALDVFGVTLEGTWEVTGEDTAKAEAGGQTIQIELADGRLLLVQDDATMTFVQIDPSERLDAAS